MTDVSGMDIRKGDKVVHTTPSTGYGRGQALRFGTVKSVREKTCTVEAIGETIDRVCKKSERVMIIERNGIYMTNKLYNA